MVHQRDDSRSIKILKKRIVSPDYLELDAKEGREDPLYSTLYPEGPYLKPLVGEDVMVLQEPALSLILD